MTHPKLTSPYNQNHISLRIFFMKYYSIHFYFKALCVTITVSPVSIFISPKTFQVKPQKQK